ncbi:MAG: LCP family protein [Clostridium sp.]|nr:LCP family protein [Clostridium sp.]
MEKESYNIDDILSEVKKRKEERENAKPDYKITAKTEESVHTSNTAEPAIQDVIVKSSQGENKEDFAKAKDAEINDEINIISDEEIIKEIPKQSELASEPRDIYVKSADGIIDKGLEEPLDFEFNDLIVNEKETNVFDDNQDEQDVPAEEEQAEEKIEAAETDDALADSDIAAADDADAPSADKEEYVNLLSYSDEDTVLLSEAAGDQDTKEPNKVKFFKTKKGKIVKTIIIVLVLVLIAVGVGGGIYIYKSLNSIVEPNANSQEQQWQGMDKLVENFPEIKETEANQLSSLQDMIKTWYYNGEPCSSSHVLNVLLVGEDTRGSDILEDETRADSAIVVSINIDTKEITLTSVLRDAYAYWENTSGDESSGTFEKINGAMSIGNIHTYIECVEKLYKIDIDNYVIVNFDSFEKIIDEIGGVTIEMTSAEINEINNHQKRYGYVTIDKTFEGNSGELQLDGKQALAYCRIRKIDSDNARADRQKTCLMEMFNKVKDSSTVTMLKVVNTLIPYVKTGFSSGDIVSMAKYALSQGWLGFDIKMTSVPYNRINESGIGGIYYGAWCWRPDYPADAYYLQSLIYGKSTITLAQERVDVIKCKDYGFYSETLTPCYATIYNYNYGETTTYETTVKEETSTSN